ncbi:hypothetical protein JCM10213_003377 [Rhodosporidiobolus nylandii]
MGGNAVASGSGSGSGSGAGSRRQSNSARSSADPKGKGKGKARASRSVSAFSTTSSDDEVALSLRGAPAAPAPTPRLPSPSPAPSEEEEEEVVIVEEPKEPIDRLTTLSFELLAHILSFLVLPPVLPSPVSHSASPVAPSPIPDGPSLASLALVCKSLLPHVRATLYRHLEVGTRVQAHSVHRTLHGSWTARGVRSVEANVEMMAKTSSQWLGWFLFHSMHSLCGIIGSCRHLMTLTLYLPAESSAWTGSLCNSFIDLKQLRTLTKDLEPSLPSSFSPPAPYTSRSPSPFYPTVLIPPGGGMGGQGGLWRWKDERGGGAGKAEGMDVGWRPRKSVSMWAVSQLIKPLSSLRSLTTLRLCGISSDSSTLPPPMPHTLRLVEVVLVEVNITNTDLLALLGPAQHLQRFTLWRSSLLSKRGLAHVLKKCPKLVELRVGGSWFGAKEEDDKNFPLDDALPFLPNLRHVFISGSLISPSALELSTLSLTHLFVSQSPSWTPAAVHASLVKMSHDPPGVRLLTLPEMRDPHAPAAAPVTPAARSTRRSQQAQANAAAAATAAGAPGGGEQWNETWRFLVRKTGEAKGCEVRDRWRAGGEEIERAMAAMGGGEEGYESEGEGHP